MSSDRYCKGDIARRLAEQQDASIAECQGWVNAVAQALRDLLLEADPVVRIEIRQFGALETRIAPARRASDPRDASPIYLPAHRKIWFTPSGHMKAELMRPLTELGHEPYT